MIDKPSPAPARPEIVAHRGGSSRAPENTLAAVRHGWEQGADAVEVDVRQTADGAIVCHHDATLGRTLGDAAAIADLTFAELQRRLPAALPEDHRVPLLSAVLATIPPDRRLLVEIKTGPEITPALADLVAAAKKAPEQIAFISFNADACRAIKRALPAHAVYLIADFEQDETGTQRPAMKALIAQARALGLDGLDLAADGPLTAENVRLIRQASLFAACWTVNDIPQAHRLATAGVQSITTDVPAALLASWRD